MLKRLFTIFQDFLKTEELIEFRICYGEVGEFSVSISQLKGNLANIEYIRLWLEYCLYILFPASPRHPDVLLGIHKDLTNLASQGFRENFRVFHSLDVEQKFSYSNLIATVSAEVHGIYRGRESNNGKSHRAIGSFELEAQLKELNDVTYRYSEAALLQFVVDKIRNNSKQLRLLELATLAFMDSAREWTLLEGPPIFLADKAVKSAIDQFTQEQLGIC